MIQLRPYVPANLETCSVDFDAAAFRRALLQKGLRLWLEPYMPCPCRSVTAVGGLSASVDAPNPQCALCQGTGALYAPGYQIPGMVSRAARKLEWYSSLGPLAPGHMMLSTLPEHVLAHQDRLTLLDAVLVYTETRVRAATVERPRYPIIKHTVTTGSPASKSTPEDVTIGVLYAYGSDAAGNVTQELVEGTDFTLVPIGSPDDGHDIDWSVGDALGTAPEVGARYSIRYYARPRLVVVEDTHARRGLYQWGTDVLERADYPPSYLVAFEHLGMGHGVVSPASSPHPGDGSVP